MVLKVVTGISSDISAQFSGFCKIQMVVVVLG
jgi:hypothetical protein